MRKGKKAESGGKGRTAFENARGNEMQVESHTHILLSAMLSSIRHDIQSNPKPCPST